MSYLFFAAGLYLTGKCCWEAYLFFFDRSMFERLRAKVELGEDIDNPFNLFIAYSFLIGACFMIGYLIYIL